MNNSHNTRKFKKRENYLENNRGNNDNSRPEPTSYNNNNNNSFGEPKKWSRLVGNSENDLHYKNSWPTLTENAAVNNNVQYGNISSHYHEKKSFIDALKSHLNTDNAIKAEIAPPLQSQQQQQFKEEKKDGESKQNRKTRKNKKKSKQQEVVPEQHEDDDKDWETVKKKKGSQKKTEVVAIPDNDNNKTKPPKNVSKDNKEGKDKDNTKLKEEKRQKKILMSKERRQKRQEQILKAREAARSDTKVTLISQNTISHLLSSPKDETNVKKGKNSNYRFKMSDYPSLEVDSSKPSDLNVDTVIMKDRKKKIQSRLNNVLEETLEGNSNLSYSSAVSIAKSVNLVETKKQKLKSNKVKSDSSNKSTVRSPTKLDLSSFVQTKISSIKSVKKGVDYNAKNVKSKTISTISSRKIRSSCPTKLHRGKNREVKKVVVPKLKRDKLKEKKRQAESFLAILRYMKHEIENTPVPEEEKLKETSLNIKSENLQQEAEISTTSDNLKTLEIPSSKDCSEPPSVLISAKTPSTFTTTTPSDKTRVTEQEASKTFLELSQEVAELQDSVHTNKFREYCNHCITPEIDEVLSQLIESLVSFQIRLYQKDPIKAQVRRRYYCGLKETNKQMNKMSCLIVAPSIRRGKGPGGLDEKVQKLLDNANEKGVPVIFGLSCKKLARLCMKKAVVSSLGIVNYQGAEDKFNRLMELIPEAKQRYEDLLKKGHVFLPSSNIKDEEES